jgi:RimJ/RimL family protein N-acetyltransferase
MSEVAIRRFPTLTVATPRLDVRPLDADDSKIVGEIFADKLVQRWLPFPREFGQIEGRSWCTELAAERRDSGAGDHYGIVRREDGMLVVSRVTEVSYAISSDMRGFGFTPEAVDALSLALVLEHGFQRIELRVAPGNLASRRVAEKAGFTYEGLLRNAGFVHSGRVDLEIWSLVAADLK